MTERRSVSVIISVFNRARLVCTAIDSVLAQTYPDFEVIVVDDGSTDGTSEVVARYAAAHPTMVRVITQANSGQASARNRGIMSARGEYIAFLDSDDSWLPNKLELQMPLFVANVGLVYCAINEIDVNGATLNTVFCDPNVRGQAHGRLLVRNRMTGGSVVVARKALDAVGLFDETLRAAENWDLWIRVSEQFDVDFVNEPLVRYLKHDANISHDVRRMIEASKAVLEKHFQPPPDSSSSRYAIYKEAYAHFFYVAALLSLEDGLYAEARMHLRKCWSFVPGYRDTRMRFARSLLGRGNRLVSEAIRIFKGRDRTARTARLSSRSVTGE